ncbi:MAG: metal-sulfur cluster assembly factor [Saprospiraceae bacterium]
MIPSTSQIKAYLKNVIDPELGINIVDLGLVYDIRIDAEARRVAIDMTLTTHACPLGDVIFEQVYETLRSSLPAYELDLQVVWDPPWSPERLTEEGRKALGKN